jgi:DNA-directed RNA polymerase specialized sigma24 family protein
MSSRAPQKGETGLTPERFERLLAWLNDDRERAGQKYEEIRVQLIKIFVSRGCSSAEELADETIDRVARKISRISGDYSGDPALYFYGVARMIYLEYLRSRPTPVELAPVDFVENDEREFDCLQQCVKRLTPKNRELILAYYGNEGQHVDQRRVLADRLGLEPNALWVRAHRIRQRLRDCVNRCLKEKQQQ